ncbi:zinc-binding alcohol dehydrogenase family protein [Aspergillus glaucus CBS 516.65]|uniref:Enoyl reductase (ER) domain-containing protein n=1 Tax=Aspergillus glaucus CBS 516.65 TaxID=1160497 RepID=A0A1L9VRL1_ASPGL|nr:hypothetical protein ASPGLDRAFT_121879 [Aspergillus glaucus CBS 516.65]OJJ86553.1 hypothetical protein ASPGLDRAFT_121879 [Aspergillus glaucus CBS 516.65]
MSTNSAAWLPSSKTNPFSIQPAPYTPPGPNELHIRNAAVAINPIDWHLQTKANFPLTYPTILGHDVAGTVAEVGSSVTNFKPGDRVLAHAMSMATQRPQDGAFQLYTTVLENVAAKIPESLAFEEAVVLPLGVSTAAAGLFQKDYLALGLPSVESVATGKTVLVWGGASSVGVNAIQLAVAAGYEVVTTASPRNFDLMRSLGASAVFDYRSETVVEDIISALQGKELAGVYDTIHTGGALQNCLAVLDKLQTRVVVVTVWPVSEELGTDVEVKSVYAISIKDNEVGRAVYNDYLPQALAEGKFVAAPAPRVVGKGLEAIQTGIDEWGKGVSAEKIVVSL